MSEPPRSSHARRVVVIQNNDPAEAFDFFRGVTHFRPAGGAWRLRNVIAEAPVHLPVPLSIVRRLQKTRFDGVIVRHEDPKLMQMLQRREVRIVHIVDHFMPSTDRPYPQVCLDQRHIGRLAAEHLLERGFKRLIYLGSDHPWSRERSEGLGEACRKVGAIHHVALASVWEEMLTHRWVAAQISQVPHPLGVMCCNDMVGEVVIEVAESKGWVIPSRLAVVGVDDRITSCFSAEPPLSSISIERFRAGFEAARLLDQQFSGTSKVGEICWLRPDRVIERESTSAHVYQDADFAEALMFIRRRACEGITVEDVLDHLQVSRSTLERRFRVLMGRSPWDEIKRIRLDSIKRSLEQPRRALFDIASANGFASVSALSHFFRASTGVSPLAYRKSLHSTVHE